VDDDKKALNAVEWPVVASRSGEDLDLDARPEPGLVRALEMVAPGTPMREGIENILHAHTGGLIVIGDPEELSFLFSGGIKLDIDYTPAFLYQVAKMDGAIVLNANATKIAMANVQLMPDPTILSHETGTRHRTAERVSKQTAALVIAVSQRREVVSLYVDGVKYILEDIPVVLAKANQALATLDKYRQRLDQVATRLTALEFEGGVTDGRRDRALHRRARQRGAADRDAARGDDPRHGGREGLAGAGLSGRLFR
jgi:diadenylate cyclase